MAKKTETPEPANTTTDNGAITGNVLFYTNPEPLSRDTHGKLGVSRVEKPFGFARAGHVVPLTVAEFGLAALSYPIIFAGEQRQPLAVMGLNAGNNLFVKDDGTFEVGEYIPAYIRRYPFVLANDEAQQRMIVCIERGAEIFREEGFDMSLFRDDGEPSEYTANAIKFCEDFETERRRTDQFVKLLSDLDLFETKRAMFTPMMADGTQGQPQQLADYFGVSEDKLRALPDDKVLELHKSGALEKIYNHLSSLVGWDRLIAISAYRQQQAQAGTLQ
ncbi:MAG TPA: SapC family protein [Caulobacteraceae bacterium]|nr:SapC family protein [Caulobacteraceae bacterium]